MAASTKIHDDAAESGRNPLILDRHFAPVESLLLREQACSSAVPLHSCRSLGIGLGGRDLSMVTERDLSGVVAS